MLPLFLFGAVLDFDFIHLAQDSKMDGELNIFILPPLPSTSSGFGACSSGLPTRTYIPGHALKFDNLFEYMVLK